MSEWSNSGKANIGGDSSMRDINKTTTNTYGDGGMIALILTKLTNIEATVASLNGLEERVAQLEKEQQYKQQKKEMSDIVTHRFSMIGGGVFLCIVLMVAMNSGSPPAPTSAGVMTYNELEDNYNPIPHNESMTPRLRPIDEWCMTPALSVDEYEGFSGGVPSLRCTRDREEFRQWLIDIGAGGAMVVSFVSSEGITPPNEMTQNPILGKVFKCAGLNTACQTLYFHTNTLNLWQNFYLPSMPAGWDNQTSSADSWTHHNMTLYEHVNFGGASIICTCHNMGAMNNHTSSIAWYN